MHHESGKSVLLIRSVCPALVIALLLLNGLGMLAGWRLMPGFDENRDLAIAPAWKASLPAYLRSFDAFVKDNFPLRKPLLLGYNAGLYYGFRSSSSSRVIIGRDGWIFGADFDAADGKIESRVLSSDYLRRLRISLEERRDWLAEQGTAFQFMFYPAKTVVYGGRYLPRHVRFDPKYASPTSQVAAAFGTALSGSFVQIEQPLRAAAFSSDGYYYRTDTHATHEAAFMAIEQMAIQLRRSDPAVPIAEYPASEFKPDLLYPTAYGRIMGIPFKEMSLVRVPTGGFNTRVLSFPPAMAPLVAEHPGAVYLHNPLFQGSSVVLLGDSFTDRMNYYLGESFAELLTINLNRSPATPEGRFPVQLLRSLRPNVVILAYLESRLADPGNGTGDDLVPLLNPVDVRQSRLRRLQAVAPEPPRAVRFKPFVSNQRVAFEVAPGGGVPVQGELLLRLTYRGDKPVSFYRDDFPGIHAAECREIVLGPDRPSAFLLLPRGPSDALGALRTDQADLDLTLLDGEGFWLPAAAL